MTQLCRKIVQANLRWSLSDKVTVFRRFFKFIWHRILACSTRPPASPRYMRLSSRRNSSPSSVAALEYPGCDPTTTSCSGGDSDLVCLKISLLGDCRIGKTSFAIRYVGDLQEQKSLQMKGLNLMDKTFDIGGARIACKLWDVGVLLDGQTEAVNRVLEMYLRCFTSDCPKKWGEWLAWAGYCYNTSFHSSLRAIPFEVIYGRQPPNVLSYCQGVARLEAVEHALMSRDRVFQNVRERLLHAQNRMKVQYDNNHRELQFNINDMVLLKLQPYRHLSLSARANRKLSPRFYGPFKVLERIGSVAYKLELPDSAKMHPVFHISFLKPFRGAETCESTLPTLPSGKQLQTPQAILDQRVHKGRKELLIHWQGLSLAEASWEDVALFTGRFPAFVFPDKHQSQGVGDVTNISTSQTPQDRPKDLIYKRFTHGRFKPRD